MKKALFLSVLLLILVHIRCSFDALSGTTSSENAKIIGSVVTKTGSGASNTIVKMIPKEYISLIDGALPDSLVDTTDQNGEFEFSIARGNVYNIEAVQITERTRLLITGVYVHGDTVLVPTDTLKQPGMIKLFIPDTLDTTGVYAVIIGTTIYSGLWKTVSDSTGTSIAIDSVPEAKIPAIFYHSATSTRIISDTITVVENDTAITDAFVFWANYTTENSSLRHNEVRDILITSDGSKWFATTGGVAKVDGIDWTLYHEGNSGLPADWVRSITIDKSGNLWFAMGIYFMDGVAEFDGAAWTTYGESNSDLPYNSVNHIMCDNTGNIWASMDEGKAVARFDGTTWIGLDSTNSGLPSNTVKYIIQDKNNNLWFATNGGVAQFDGTTWTVYNTDNSGIGSNINYSIGIERNGTIWFGHEGSISKYDGANWTIYDGSFSDLLSVGGVQTIVEDTAGNIWIGTMWGLIKFDGVTWTDYNGKRYKQLDGKAIYAISFDRDNNMWLGTWRSGVMAFGPTVK